MKHVDPPGWINGATASRAFVRGLSVALAVPGLVLFCTSIGFGALARDLGVTLGHTIFLTAVVYATPAQIVLIDQLARGATLGAALFAVSLTAVRLLPMVVTLIPHLKHGRRALWLQVLTVHFVAITAWVEAQRRLPTVPEPLRLPHFLGIGMGLCGACMVGSACGYVLATTLSPVLSASLLFLTPLYFLLSMLATARSRPDYVAIASGCILGPVLYVMAPGVDLLATGLVGGTLAYMSGRARA